MREQEEFYRKVSKLCMNNIPKSVLSKFEKHNGICYNNIRRSRQHIIYVLRNLHWFRPTQIIIFGKLGRRI